MIDPVNNKGNPLAYPLKLCDCGQRSCEIAVDQNGFFAYERSTLCNQSIALKWSDILNEPGWNNGYPPWYGGQGVGLTAARIIADALIVRETCDCGMAASDYSVSRHGGPGHSDWCKVADR